MDNLSWTKGKHTLKFGGEYRFYITPQNFTQRQRGDYEYGSTQLFMEDFAPDLFGERSTGAHEYYGNQYGAYWYANDTFRMNQHLTLNLGVRYEYNSTPQSENQQILNAISNTPSITVAGTNQPLIFGKPQAPKHDFAPRIGFAYSPGTNGTTSIRGGFGMAYDLLYDNIGILAVPPQIGATNDVAAITPGFYAGGGLPAQHQSQRLMKPRPVRLLRTGFRTKRSIRTRSIGTWEFNTPSTSLTRPKFDTLEREAYTSTIRQESIRKPE